MTTELIKTNLSDSKHALICGDNLAVLQAMREPCVQRDIGLEAFPVMLIYMDPPFNTGRTFKIKQKPGSSQDCELKTAFKDSWGGLDDFLSMLRPRIEVCRDLLDPRGSLVVHVDPKTSHYVKVMCDEIFGPECFASEIIWRYRRWPAATGNLQRMHDVLLRYVRDPSAEHRFCQLYEPLAESTKKAFGNKKQFAYKTDSGTRKTSASDEQSPGTLLSDVWDIGILAPSAKERTGYPTQKPEALMDRVIGAFTFPGDLVLDPNAGSGTTLASAVRMSRFSIGIDSNSDAITICRERLKSLGVFPQEFTVQQKEISANG